MYAATTLHAASEQYRAIAAVPPRWYRNLTAESHDDGKSNGRNNYCAHTKKPK